MKRVLVLFVVGVVLFGACSAQNANAQNANVAQRIIGTWVDQYGNTWVFNANGNLTRTSTRWGTSEYKFGVTDTRLAFVSASEYGTPDAGDLRGGNLYNISISSDGRTIILDYNGESGGETRGYWFTKR